MVSIRTLGKIDLRDADGRQLTSILAQPQLTALLVYLASSGPGSFHRRDTLIDLMWPRATDAQARHRLNQALYELRRAVGEDVIVSRGRDEVGFGDGQLRCDLDDFRLALGEARHEDALEHYEGPFLSGFYASSAPGLERWIDHEREAIRGSAMEAASLLRDECGTRGDLRAALHWAQRASEIAPQSEPALRSLMEILAETGDRLRALQAYEEFRAYLHDNFDMEPAPETTWLAEEVRRGSVGRIESARVPAAGGQGDLSPEASAGMIRRPVQRRRNGPNLGLTLAGAGIALLGFAAVLWALLSSAGGVALDGRPGTSVIAVAPIQVKGDLPAELGDLGAALADELARNLSRIPEALVIPASVVAEHVAETASLREAGQSMSADVVVDAKLEWDGGKARSTASLIDVASGRVLWDVDHLHPSGGLLDAQRDITIGVAAALNSSGLPLSDGSALPSSDERLLSWALTARAKEFLDSAPTTPNGYRRADHVAVHSLLTRALHEDPENASAIAVRSMGYSQHWYERRDQRALLDTALVLAERAVAVAPDDPLPYLALVRALSYSGLADGDAADPTLAPRRFEAALRAVQLNPNSEEATGTLASEGLGVGRKLLWDERHRLLRRRFAGIQYRRSHWLWIMGDYEGALEAHRRMVVADPTRAPLSKVRVAELYLSRGDIRAVRAAIAGFGPAEWRLPLAKAVEIYVNLREGRYEAAERRILELIDTDSITVVNTANFHARTALAFVYLKTGRAGAGRQLALTLRDAKRQHISTGAGYVSYYDMVRLHAMLGNVDAAVEWTERAIDRGWIFYYTEMGLDDPMLQNVRDDPRFLALMEGLREELDAELAWVRELMALPEPERLRAMLLDAERLVDAMWTEVSGGQDVAGRDAGDAGDAGDANAADAAAPSPPGESPPPTPR